MVGVGEFIDGFQELGCSRNEDEISTWLNIDKNDPGSCQMMKFVTRLHQEGHQDDEHDDSEEQQHVP